VTLPPQSGAVIAALFRVFEDVFFLMSLPPVPRVPELLIFVVQNPVSSRSLIYPFILLDGGNVVRFLALRSTRRVPTWWVDSFFFTCSSAAFFFGGYVSTWRGPLSPLRFAPPLLSTFRGHDLTDLKVLIGRDFRFFRQVSNNGALADYVFL